MISPGIEVPGLILLELKPVDHNRAVGALGSVWSDCSRVGIGVAGHESNTFSIRRPGIFGDSARQIGQPLRLPTAPVEEPDLLDFPRVFPVGQEGQVAAIRAPAGRML